LERINLVLQRDGRESGVVEGRGFHLVHSQVGSPVPVGMYGLQSKNLVGRLAESRVCRAVQPVPCVVNLVYLALFYAVAEVGEAQVLPFTGMQKQGRVRRGDQHISFPCQAMRKR
jgi:hypothetical protein